MDLNQAEQGLLFFFCQNFGNYLMIFQSFAARSTLKNHQICQKKSCLKPMVHTAGSQNLGFLGIHSTTKKYIQ